MPCEELSQLFRQVLFINGGLGSDNTREWTVSKLREEGRVNGKEAGVTLRGFLRVSDTSSLRGTLF